MFPFLIAVSSMKAAVGGWKGKKMSQSGGIRERANCSFPMQG